MTNLDLTKLTTDELCKLQMDLGASISSLIANEKDSTSHYELWQKVIGEIVSRND